MHHTRNIVVVGSLNIDLVVRTAHLPAPGQTVRGRDFRTYPGGKGANQAVAAGRLAGAGTTVHMVGRVGEDGFGEALLESLGAAGVAVEHVLKTPGPTGNAVIAVEDSGENVIIITAAANGLLAVADVEAAAALLRRADALLLQLEVPTPAIERAAAIAVEAGATVLLNPAPAPERTLSPALLRHVSVLIPNETEALAMTGEPDPERAAAALRALGVGTVVLTQGGEGALVLTAEGAAPVPAYPITPVDTTAAGDAFVGGLAVALIDGLALPDAVRFAAAAGALAATRPGAQPSLPTRNELVDFMKDATST